MVIHPLPLLAWGIGRTRGRSVLVEEHVFDVLTKDAGNLKSERKTRVVATRLDGVDAGARHSHVRRKLCLRPFLFRSKYSQSGLHSSRPSSDLSQEAARIKPSVHRTIMQTGTPNRGTAGRRRPNALRKSNTSVSATKPTHQNTNAK